MVQLCPSPTRTNLPTFPSGNINVWNVRLLPGSLTVRPSECSIPRGKGLSSNHHFPGRAVKPGCVWHFSWKWQSPHHRSKTCMKKTVPSSIPWSITLPKKLLHFSLNVLFSSIYRSGPSMESQSANGDSQRPQHRTRHSKTRWRR